MKKIIILIGYSLLFSCGYGQKKLDKERDKNPTFFNRKNQFGVVFGIGASKFKVTNSNWRQGVINYNDSLNSIESTNILKIDLGLIYQLNFTNKVAFRPAMTLSFEGGKFAYNKKQTTEEKKIFIPSFYLSLPLVLKIPSKTVKPYVSIGPSICMTPGQEEKEKPIYLPVKHFDVVGDFSFGVEWNSKLLKCIAAPELRLSTGLTNIKRDANNLYANTIESFKRRALTFSIYFRQ